MLTVGGDGDVGVVVVADESLSQRSEKTRNGSLSKRRRRLRL